ncbi:hypothetical protein HDE_13403 [Halotydeus destructor]|nr:hypothetical protein HDE_13403 [Halotydeus destructor]
MEAKKSSKKKGKNKLITFIEGSKCKELRFVSQEDSVKFNDAIKEIVSAQVDLRLPKRVFDKRNKGTKIKGDAEQTSTNVDDATTRPKTCTLKKEMMFGINEILRNIEKGNCVGVVLTNPLTTHLQLSVNELCNEKQVKCMNVTNFNQLGSVFNISSLTAMAFKNSSQTEGSLCQPILTIFHEFYDKAKSNAQTDPLVSQANEVPVDGDERVTPTPTLANKIHFITPKFEDLYVLKAPFTGSASLSVPTDSDSLLLKISNHDDYFPAIRHRNLDDCQLTVDVNHDTSDSHQFTHEIMEVDVVSATNRQAKKRKNSPGQSSKAESKKSKFKQPQMKVLEPSGKGQVKKKIKKAAKEKWKKKRP